MASMVAQSELYERESMTTRGGNGSRPAPSAFVVDRITRSSPWFYRTPISDEVACEILRGAPDGCFLVRASEIPDSFILSYW